MAQAVVNLAAEIASAQRTVAAAEATWAAGPAAAAAHSKAQAVAVARHAPPVRAAVQAGVAVAAQEVEVAGVVEAAAGGADKLMFGEGAFDSRQ